ncbi:MAG: diphthine--ammonia ligase [Candidatus Heimdallarchaeota archaeon]|nr:MAG: diphthine--ammonia ligase [Candidatus Heimdallarchaeota archaeon]
MKVSCLVSGGKDSVLALWFALHQFDVISILTVKSTCPDSLLFHIPNCEHVSLVAEMLGLLHQTIWIDKCNINDEVRSLKEALLESGAEAIITGGIRSEFQRIKFNRAALRANLKCYNPLWRLTPQILLTQLLESKFDIIITSVSGMGLRKEFLGKTITPELIETIQQTVPESELTIIGEGGEFESFVLDAPFFPARIKIIESKIHWNEFREEGYYEIKRVKKIPKKFSQKPIQTD